MKTYIVQLEDHDDIISARDKISWSKARRVLLVWPRKGRVLERRVDLLLLKRHSQQLGMQLAVVTRSGEVLANARQLGIPTFDSAVTAQDASWRRSRGRMKLPWQQRSLTDPQQFRERLHAVMARTPETRWLRYAMFGLGILAVLSLVLFFLPGAQVELQPAQATQEMSLAIWASPEIRSPSALGGIPAQVQSVVVEGRDQAVSTGRVRTADRPASGQVQFTNLTDQPVEIPWGTVVRTNDSRSVRYEVTEPVQAPSGPGKTVMARVQALEPGSAGNQSVGKIRAIEGDLGLRLSVDNVNAVSGGSDRNGLAPSTQDYRALREKLLADLQAMALEELSAGLKPGTRLLVKTVYVGQVIEETREPEADQPGDRLQLSMRVEYDAWVVAESDLEWVAQAALDVARKPGYLPVADSMVVNFASEPVLDEEAKKSLEAKTSLAALPASEVPAREQSAGTVDQGSVEGTLEARGELFISRQLEADLPETSLVRAILGRTPAEAGQVIQSTYQLAQPPVIRLYPGWWGRLPYLPFRITLLKYSSHAR